MIKHSSILIEIDFDAFRQTTLLKKIMTLKVEIIGQEDAQSVEMEDVISYEMSFESNVL